MPVKAMQVGREICALLGLNDMKVQRIEFIFKVGDIVRINAVLHAEQKDVDGLFDIVRRFKLVELEEETKS